MTLPKKIDHEFMGTFGREIWAILRWETAPNERNFLNLLKFLTVTFAKSARFQVPKNGTSNAETKKRRPLFNANIPPKW